MECKKVTLSDTNVQFIDDTTNDLLVSKELLPVVEIGDTICVHFTQDVDTVDHIFVVDELGDNVKLVWQKLVDLKLTEASPVIKLDSDDMFNPDSVDFKDKIQKGIAVEKEKEAAEQKAKLESEFKEKHPEVVAVLESSDTTTNKIDKLHDLLVPMEGAAHTVAGEYVRAIMRILARDYNDGDKFFEGYGLETCGSSAEYLLDKGFDQIMRILDQAPRFSDDDELYTEAVLKLAEDVISRISENIDLLWTINEEDSRDYSYETIEEYQPRYEFELSVSDDVSRLLDAMIVTAWDLNGYVEDNLDWNSIFDGAEVDRPWSQYSDTVSVSNLTKDGYEALQEQSRNLDAYWSDFVSNYADELSELDDDADDFDDTTDEFDEE